MPLWYRGIIEEHNAVRNAAGLFDVSHMGRIWITGKDATQYLDHVLPTASSSIRDGKAFYSAITNPKGGIKDDVIADRFNNSRYLMVVNAGNREKDLAWLVQNSHAHDVQIQDISDESALFALQGPCSNDILQSLVDFDVHSLKRFSFLECSVAGEKCLVSRTGYTGEDGFEIAVYDTPVANPERALTLWNRILEAGRESGLIPCGLGARDSLRLEAGLCLYGQDIDESTTPIEAALEGILHIAENSKDFIGKETIEPQLKEGTSRRRVCFEMLESGIPRHGFQVLFAGNPVGTVTSGTFAPTLKKGIGMAYVPTPLSEAGRTLSVQVRDLQKSAQVVNAPFYDTTKYGYRRTKSSAS